MSRAFRDFSFTLKGTCSSSGRAGALFRLEPRKYAYIEHVDASQHKAGNHAASKKTADGSAGNEGIHDHDHGRRNKEAQSATSHDYAHGKLFIVFVCKHGRYGNDTHGQHRSGADAKHGGHKSADHHGTDAKSTAQPARPHIDRIEQVFGYSRLMKHEAHEHEQRAHDEHDVRAKVERGEIDGIEGTFPPEENGRKRTYGAEAVNDGESGSYESQSGKEHDPCDLQCGEFHYSSSSPVQAIQTFRRNSAKVWSIIRENATGMIILKG